MFACVFQFGIYGFKNYMKHLCWANGTNQLLLDTCCGTRLELELHRIGMAGCKKNPLKQPHFVGRS